MDKDRRTSKLFGSRISSIFNPHTNPNAAEVKSLILQPAHGTSKSIQPQQSYPAAGLGAPSTAGSGAGGYAGSATGASGTEAGATGTGSGWSQREPTTPVRSSYLSPGQNPQRQVDHLYQLQPSAASGGGRAGVSPSPRPLNHLSGNNRNSTQSNTTTTSGITINSDGSMSVLRPMSAIPDHLQPQIISPNKHRLSRKPPPASSIDELDDYNKSMHPTRTPPTPPPPPIHTVSNPAVLDRIPLFDSLNTTPLPMGGSNNYSNTNTKPVGLEMPALSNPNTSNNSISKLRRSGDRKDLLDIIGSLENDIRLLSPGEHNHEYQEDIDFIDDIDPLHTSRLGRTGLPLPNLSINYDDANPFLYGEDGSDTQRSQRDSNYNTSGGEGSITELNSARGSGRLSSSSLLLQSAYNTNSQEMLSLSSESRAGTGFSGAGGDSNFENSRSGSLSVTNKLNLVDSVPYPLDSSNSSLNSPLDVFQPIFSNNSIEGRQYDTARGNASIHSGPVRGNSQRQLNLQYQQPPLPSLQHQSLTSLLMTAPYLIIQPLLTLTLTAVAANQAAPPSNHRKSSSISSLMSSSSFRNVNLGSIKRTLNLQPGEGERSNYVLQIRRSAGTAYNESQPGKWKLPIGILPIDKNANYTLSNGRYIRLAGASQGRVKKGSGVELKHGHLAPRLLAAEVEDIDSSIPGMNSRLGRAGTAPSLQLKSNVVQEKNKSSSSSIHGSNLTRTTTIGDSQSIVTGGESANSELTRSLSSSSSGSVPEEYMANYQHPGYRIDDDDDSSEIQPFQDQENDGPQTPHLSSNKSNGYGGRIGNTDVDAYDDDVGTNSMNGLNLNGDYDSTHGYDLEQEDRLPRLVLANPDSSDSE